MAHRDGQSWKKVWRKEGPFLKGAGKEVPKGTSFFWGGLERKFLSNEDQPRSVEPQNRSQLNLRNMLLAQMTMSDKTTVVDDSEVEVTLMINWGREIPRGQRCDNRSEM